MANLTATIIEYPCANLAALKAIDTTGRGNILAEVQTLGVYQLNPTSVAAGDDRDIVAPTVGPGRWYRLTLASLITTAGGLIDSASITATPSFTSETLSATTNQLVLGTTNTTTVNSIAPAASRVYSIQDLGAAGNVVLAEGTTAKNIAFDITGSTDAKTMTLVSSHTDDRSITFPDATGTLVTLENPQAFTDATDATNATTAAITTAGGLGVAKKLYVGTGIYVPTTGGTASELNFYEKTTLATTLTGIWAADQAITFRIERIGSTVTISWDGTVAAVNAAATVTINDAFLARFRPSANMYIPIGVLDNSVETSGWCVFTAATGLMVFSVGAFANYTNANNGGILGGSISFTQT